MAGTAAEEADLESPGDSELAGAAEKMDVKQRVWCYGRLTISQTPEEDIVAGMVERGGRDGEI